MAKSGKHGAEAMRRLNRFGLFIGGDGDASVTPLESFLKKILVVCNLSGH